MRSSLVAVILLLGACTPAVVGGSSGASSTPGIADRSLLWALDRGPEGTPDQSRLRVYVFGVGELRGPVKLIAPNGAVVGQAAVMGSGIFNADSCVSREASKAKGVDVIGAIEMTDAAQSSFLADPALYRAAVDLGQITPGAGTVTVRLADTGCRSR